MIHCIENSRKSTQLCLNFSLTTGTSEMEALNRLRVSSWDQTPLLESYTRRWCQTPRRWTCPVWLRQQPSGCVTWSMNAFVNTETKEFFSCYWTKWQDNVVLMDKVGKFYDKCHRHRAIRAMAEKTVSTGRGLAGTYLAVLKNKIPSFEVTTHSPILPWTIRHATWVLTRYNVRRDTRMTPYEKIRGQKYRKEILPLGEQLLARRPGASVNRLLQPWVTGLWLGRGTLSDEHLMGTAAGVMRSGAVRRLQEPARWVPAALKAMLFTRGHHI